MSKQSQWLIEGSPVYTLDENLGVAEAMVVGSGLVVEVGDRRTLKDKYPSAKSISLDGGAVIPAFNDSHAHLLLLGQDLGRCDLGACRSRKQAFEALSRWAARNPDEPWIMGWNFRCSEYEDNTALPDRRSLDQVSADQPVMVSHFTKHALLLNSAALKAAGITAGTPDPDGGIIERDSAGEPTGVVREMAAMELVERAVPDPGVEGIAKALAAAAEHLAGMGILAATEAYAGNWYPLPGKIAAYNRMLAQGSPLRINLLCDYRGAEAAGWLEGPVPPLIELHPELSISHLKLMGDGAIAAGTAALSQPYLSTGSLGYLALEPEELEQRIIRAHRAGWATATHAIGDRTIEITLAAIEKALAGNQEPEGIRHRLDHAILLNPTLLGRLKKAGVALALQPQFMWDMGDAHYAALGERALTEKPCRSILGAGLDLGFGSDLNVVSGDPIIGWRTAVTRRTKSGFQLARSEALEPLEALKCYTLGSAKVGNDNKIGTLAPGKQARFAVLSHRPELIAEEDLKVIGTSNQLVPQVPEDI